MKFEFVPSLMGMDLMNVERDVTMLNQHAKMLHIDLIDWHYAENMFVSPMFIQQLRPLSTAEFDVHFMINGLPMSIIQAVAEAGADILSLHAEDAQKNIFKYIDYIKSQGKKLGIVLNPATSLDVMRYYIEHVDLITFMGVTPGFAGQALIPVVLDKIRDAIQLRDEKGYKFSTMIDGGCHKGTMKAVSETRVEKIIMGRTCLFGQDQDIHKAWNKMEDSFTVWTK